MKPLKINKEIINTIKKEVNYQLDNLLLDEINKLAITISNCNYNIYFKGKLKDLYNEFCKESHSELFDTQEEAIKYYSIPKNYKSLLNGDVGENLLAKYTSKGVLIYDDIITSIFYIIKNQLSIKYHSELNSILNSSEKWLKNLYLIDEIFGDDKNVEKNTKYQLDMEFDFHSDLQGTLQTGDWYWIDTPNFQMLLDHQEFSEEECRWIYAFLGRVLYEVNEIDGWQVIPFFKSFIIHWETGDHELIYKV